MPFGSEFLDTGGTLRAYLARQELNQRQQQLDQQREYAKDLLDLHNKQLDQTAKAHMDDVKYRNMVFKQIAQEHYNNLLGNPLDAPSSSITGITPQTSIDQQPNEQYIPGATTPAGQANQPAQIGAITPDVQHSMQFQAQPWQYTPPEMQGSDIGPLTIDPDYQAKLQRAGLSQATMDAHRLALMRAAIQPFEMQLAGQKNDAAEERLRDQIQNKLELMDKANQARLTQTQMKDATSEIVAWIRAAAMMNNQLNPDSIVEHWQAQRLGNEDENSTPMKERGPVQGLMRRAGGERPFSTKDAANLRQITSLDGMFGRLEDVGKYLSDEPSGRMAGYLKSFLPTEFNNALNQFRMDAPEGVRKLTGVNTGRLLQFELENFIKANAGGVMKHSIYVKDLADLKQDYYQEVLGNLLGGMPMSQQSDIINANRQLHKHFWVPIHNNTTNKDMEVYIEDYNKAMQTGEYSPYNGPPVQHSRFKPQ
jgi:DNA-binding transcriptional MerR regulator